jgi:predicted metal-binding membrane protein
MSSTGLTGAQTSARTSQRTARRALVWWPAALMVGAWALAVLATFTNQRYLIDHQYLLVESRLPWLAALAIFLAAWQVMTLAMMLPFSLPVVNMLVCASRSQDRPRVVQGAFLAGYAAIWTAFGLGAFLGDTLVHRLVFAWPWLALHSWVIGASTLAAAGAFQLSRLKERCLTACRSPFTFFLHYPHRGVGAAWRLGLRHGAFCLGSCWALMLVMFGIGAGSLAWMAVLAILMAVERAAPGGRRLRLVFGIALLALSALWVAQPAWLLASGI